MTNIQISPLLPVGYDLFNDTNSFLNELATEEVQNIFGEGCHSGGFSASASASFSDFRQGIKSDSGGFNHRQDFARRNTFSHL
jgi:hypothetical protein